MMPVNVLVEGMADEPVAKKLLSHVGLEIGTIYGRKGKSHLLERVSIYNKSADKGAYLLAASLENGCPSLHSP